MVDLAQILQNGQKQNKTMNHKKKTTNIFNALVTVGLNHKKTPNPKQSNNIEIY